MPGFTYLSDWEAREWLHVEGDKDCDELLQEMNAKSGRTWLIQVKRWFAPRGWFRHAEEIKYYTLYLDCHGEYQVMNLVGPNGGSVFHFNRHSREAVMNYMLGYLGGLPAHPSTDRGDAA